MLESHFQFGMFRFKIQVAFAKGEAIRLGASCGISPTSRSGTCQLRERSRPTFDRPTGGARSRRERRNSAQFQGSKAEGEQPKDVETDLSIGLHQFSGWWHLKYVLFSNPYLGKIPNLTNIFQMGWNHQLVNHWTINCWSVSERGSVCCHPISTETDLMIAVFGSKDHVHRCLL